MSKRLTVETTVGERVWLARTRSGNHNAKAFYEGMGLNRDHMSRVERGIDEPKFAELAAIAAVTGYSLEWLEGHDIVGALLYSAAEHFHAHTG